MRRHHRTEREGEVITGFPREQYIHYWTERATGPPRRYSAGPARETRSRVGGVRAGEVPVDRARPWDRERWIRSVGRPRRWTHIGGAVAAIVGFRRGVDAERCCVARAPRRPRCLTAAAAGQTAAQAVRAAEAARSESAAFGGGWSKTAAVRLPAANSAHL